MAHILLLPGDGIGPEVIAQTRRVIEWFCAHRALEVEMTEGLVGGCAYEAHGVAVTDETLQEAKRSHVVLLGAVGGPQWDRVPYEVRPEAGLLRLRKELELFANLRPALCFGPLAEASSLKRELVEGLDILIVRELTGGVYFGEPRGIEDLGDGRRRGVNTQVYDSEEIRRVGQVAFDLARARRGQVTSVEKRNVMESGLLWHQEITALHQEQHTDIVLEHMLADTCAMQLVRAPKQFDVIVTDNLFGDLLSDVAAMLTGSLGMLPSASLGAPGGVGLYEPVHGSAPDIAGQNCANPLATILSFAMALRYSLGRAQDAESLEGAVGLVLKQGWRTRDIMEKGLRCATTEQMGQAVLAALEEGT